LGQRGGASSDHHSHGRFQGPCAGHAVSSGAGWDVDGDLARISGCASGVLGSHFWFVSSRRSLSGRWPSPVGKGLVPWPAERGPHHGPGHSGVDPLWEQVLLAGTVVVAALGALVLATGHTSALVFKGGWPNYAGMDVPGVLWRFLEDPLDPADAWEPVNRGAAIPGAAAWWSTGVALSAMAAIPVVALLRSADQRGSASGRWARWWELRRLWIRRGRRGRLVVGTSGGRKVAVESRHSLLVFGPTQSRKTTALAIPAILEWPGPVVATSTKGDLVDDTIGWRSRMGDVHIFDPAGATRFTASGWSPLAECHTWLGATRTAWELAMAGKAAVGGGMALADFWFTSASKALAPYLFAAAKGGRRIDQVAHWIDREERDEVLSLLRHLHPDAVLVHEATFRREDRARSSLFQVMQQILGVYLDPRVAASAARHDISAPALIDGGSHTLYVTAPHHDQARLRPLFATLIGQVITAVYERVAATGRPLSAPLLLVLDEAANIAPIEDLPTVASTAAAMGLQLVTVFQDLAQVKGRYPAAAGTIVNNHRAKLMLPGVSDVDTLELMSRLAGDQEVDRDSVTVDLGGRRSTTRATHWRRLLPPELARQLADGHGVLVYGNMPPIQLRLRPWYRDRRLRHRGRTAVDELQSTPGARSVPTTETSPPRPAMPSQRSDPAVGQTEDAESPGTVTALDAARARLRQRPTRPPGGEP
jgi:type IV secretion system protein VirD4